MAVAKYLSLTLQPPHWFSTFPAGGGGKARGGQLKAMGLKAGVPDILIISGFTGRANWIELKAPQGTESVAQKETRKALEYARCGTAVCRSIEDVQAALEAWGFNVKARAAE
jgi:hypothetical protein